jgi:GAF domain-containing protein
VSDDETVHHMFEALSQVRVTDDANLQDALRKVATAGCQLISNCTAASVTLIEDGRASTVGSTGGVADAVDQIQYAVGDGPCLQAAREGRVVHLDGHVQDPPWPEFVSAAAENGVLSTLSLPVTVPGNNTCGSLNLYSGEPNGFSDTDEALCKAFALHASVVVSNAHAYWAAQEMTRNLTSAMASRSTIEQAKGMLMASHRVSAAEAFEMLVRRSQAENRKVRDIAASMIELASQGDDQPTQ